MKQSPWNFSSKWTLKGTSIHRGMWLFRQVSQLPAFVVFQHKFSSYFNLQTRQLNSNAVLTCWQIFSELSKLSSFGFHENVSTNEKNFVIEAETSDPNCRGYSFDKKLLSIVPFQSHLSHNWVKHEENFYLFFRRLFCTGENLFYFIFL